MKWENKMYKLKRSIEGETWLARDRTEEYWPSVAFVQTSLRTIWGQYFPVRSSRSVCKRLAFSAEGQIGTLSRNRTKSNN